MKKKLILTTVIIAISTALFAQEQDRVTVPREKNVFVNPSDNEFMWKIGTSYAQGPGRFGLDISFNYVYNIDPVFTFGFEGDFFWINWKNKLEDINVGGGSVGASRNATTNLYTFPFFANAQLRLPFLKSKIYVEPAATIGLGYAFMFLSYSSEDKSGLNFYSGLALQGFGSIYYKIFSGSAVDFVFDIGYRYLPLNRKGIEIDMSGIIARVGVKVYI